MATAPSPFPTFPSVTPPPPFCFGAPPYAPYPFPYPNQPPPPSPSYHAAAYHHHHRFQLPPPSHPNPHWHQGMQQMQPPPPTPGNPWHPHHAADQPPPPSSPPPLAASMAAAAPAWPFPSAFVPAVQEGAAPSTSSSRRLPDSPGTTSAPAAALIVLCSGPGPERRPSSPSSAPVPAPSATQARRSTPPTTNTPSASGASTGPAVLGSTTAAPLVGNTTTLPAATTSPTTTPSTEARVPAEASISKNMPCAILDLKRRLDEQQARDRTSFDKLRGELAKLTSMATQLAISIGKQSSAAESSSTTAYVAQHVFDKMPTPNSGFENCSAHPNQIQSSCVQGGSTNLREKNIEELPQAYGPHNLICRTVVRADGSEHSYYKLPGYYPLERAIPEQLPEDYQLEQATKPMSPPTEKNVGVMVPPYVAAQTAGLASVCCLKDNTTTSSDSLLVPSLQLPMNVQQASADVFVGIPEQQKFEDQQQVQVLKPLFEQLLRISSRAPETEQTSADMLDFTLEQQQQNDENTSANVQQLRDSQLTVLAIHERRSEWDPGDTSLHFLFTTAAGATKLDYAAVYKSAMAESLCATTAVQVTDCMQYIASNGINHIMQSAAHLPQGNYLCFLYYNSVLKTGYQGMRYVWAFSIAKGRQVQWDPGIELIMFLYKQTHAHIIQLVDLTSTATDDFLQGQQPCLHICLYCPHSDPLQQLVCYSSMFSSSAMSISTAATLHVSLVLSSGKTAQEEKYAAAMYQLLKPQIPMRKTSRIWDPGIEFILYELWWFSKGTGYVLRHLLAVKFGTPSYTYSSDTAANMYCPPANLIQQRRNTAALLQFGHSAVCVWDPGIAFVYQQGVQENHNGKQLLASSKNCLHIWEIDILFITFLPP